MRKVSRLAGTALITAFLGGIPACGDEEVTGPKLGDVEFLPASPVDIGLARQVALEMVNRSDLNLGPIRVGTGVPLSIPPPLTCPRLDIQVDPGTVAAMPPGAAVDVALTFDFAGLSEEDCPFSEYQISVNAAQGQTVLGSAQVQLDHPALE